MTDQPAVPDGNLKPMPPTWDDIREAGNLISKIGAELDIANIELERLQAEIEARDKRLAAIAELALQRVLISDRTVMMAVLQKIEVIAKGEGA